MGPGRRDQRNFFGYGFVLASNVEFPELPLAIATSAPDLEFELIGASSDPGRSDDSYRFTYEDLADFEVSGDTRRVRCFPGPGVTLDHLRHVFLNHTLPVVLGLRGAFVLHAGAVVLSGKAVALAGPSGAGKSTLTAGLGRAGFEIVTDDCLVLNPGHGGYLAAPSYPAMRLNRDSAAALFRAWGQFPETPDHAAWNKLRVTGDGTTLGFCADPAPLGAVVVLSGNEAATADVSLHPLTPSEGLTEILKHVLRTPGPDRAWLKREFNHAGAIARTSPIFRLRYPREFSALSEVIRTVCEFFGSAAPEPPVAPPHERLARLF